MVPTLKIPKNALIENGFINGFVADVNKEGHYENAVYILFKPKNLDKFKEFLENEYERTKNIIEDYDYPDGYVVIVYKLESSLEKDFILVKKGLYSKTSPSYQKRFSKTITLVKDGVSKEEISLQYRVFSRSEDLIEYWEDKLAVRFGDNQELWEAFDEEKEKLDIYTINKTETINN